MARAGPRKLPYHTLIAALLAQGISGLLGGSGLVADPSGEALGIPHEWLQGTPFADYLIPGVILASVLGVLPLAVAYGIWQFRGWAWFGSLFIGTALECWIVVEIVMIGYQPEPPLQALYGALGLLIIGLTLTPSVRARLRGGAPW